MSQRTKTILALVAVLLSPLAANADPIVISPDDGETIFNIETPSGSYDSVQVYLTSTGTSDCEGDLIIYTEINGGGSPGSALGSDICDYSGLLTQQTFSPSLGTGFSLGVEALAGTWTINELYVVLFETDDFAGQGTDPIYLVGGSSVSVPEPGTLALLGAGLLGMGFARRRKKT